METTTNCCPEQRVMIGNVVSIVVAPPADIGARLPNQRTNRGAQSKVIISRIMLESKAMVPSSGPLYCVIKITGKGIISESCSYSHTIRSTTMRKNQAYQSCSRNSPQYSSYRKKYQAWIQRTKILQGLRVMPHTQSYTEHQGTQGIKTDIAFTYIKRNQMKKSHTMCPK